MNNKSNDKINAKCCIENNSIARVLFQCCAPISMQQYCRLSSPHPMHSCENITDLPSYYPPQIFREPTTHTHTIVYFMAAAAGATVAAVIGDGAAWLFYSCGFYRKFIYSGSAGNVCCNDTDKLPVQLYAAPAVVVSWSRL